MEDGDVKVALYWNGWLMNGQNGVGYDSSPKRIIKLTRRTSMAELLDKLYNMIEIDKNKNQIKLLCRYPLSCTSHVISYTTIPVKEDEDLELVLDITSDIPAQKVIELYVEKEPVKAAAGSHQPIATPQMPVGSSSPALLQKGSHADLNSKTFQSHVKQTPDSAVSDETELLKKLGADVFFSYKKAPMEKRQAIEQVYGDWDASYTQLPRYFSTLQWYNPGTVVVWRHGKKSTENIKIFNSVFWAFKPSIDGFVHCRPVICVDETHQYGKYKEKIYIAHSLDAANYVFPLAFAIVKEENVSNWSWFLENLKRHVIRDRMGICLISDCGQGILQTIHSNYQWRPPLAHHRYCLKHVKRRFTKQFKCDLLTEYMSRAASCHQVCEFDETMARIKEHDEDAFNWLKNLPLQKWTLCHDGGVRYGIMTTNHSEALNGILKGAKLLPISAFAKLTFNRLANYFNLCRDWADGHLRKCQPWPSSIYQLCKQNETEAYSHRATACKGQLGQLGHYEVTTKCSGNQGGQTYVVKLKERSCTCGYFDFYKMPCSHAMKVCNILGRTFFDLIHRCYTSQQMLNTYAGYFNPISKEEHWLPCPFTLVLNVDSVDSENSETVGLRFMKIGNEMDQRGTQTSQSHGGHGHFHSKMS